MSTVQLSVGEARSEIEIFARERWNPTGVHVHRGQRYRLSAKGIWHDAGIETGPDGFSIDDAPAKARLFLRLGRPFIRMKQSQYFCLIGSVNRASHTFFQIGSGDAGEWSVSSGEGELFAFANDVPFAYFNNSGSILLSVTRVA